MIFDNFKLEGNPFAETLELADIHMDGRFQSVLTSLESLPQIGDLATLTGRTGTGKTTLLRQLMSKWRSSFDVYYLHLGNLRGAGLFRALLNTLGERPRMGKDRMFDQLYSHLNKKQRPLCMIIDEVQLMDITSMTDLRLLGGHLELAGRFKLVLAGQPQMNRTLQVDSLTDLRERITLQVHLKSMTMPETHAYIEHRLQSVGGKEELFDDASVKLIHHHSEGIPRRVNGVALKAMMNAWGMGKSTIDNTIVREACAAEFA